MSEPEIVEDFFGVYLLYNINPKYKGRTYIGYTRDPNRRIMQHNRGTWAGGAYRTSNRGPWKMVLIVHGFPNNISALRFEWAWQNPNKTIRLQHLNLKKIPRKESEFQFKLRVMSEMLGVGPWCRLPLLIRWLEKDFYQELPQQKNLPQHMSIVNGPVKARNLETSREQLQNVESNSCSICFNNINSSTLKCHSEECHFVSHLTCLADLFLAPGEYIPIEGSCPLCNMKMKWGELIRKNKFSKGKLMEGDRENCGRDVENIDEENITNNVINEEKVIENPDEDDIVINNESCSENIKKHIATKRNDDEELPYWFDDCNYDL